MDPNANLFNSLNGIAVSLNDIATEKAVKASELIVALLFLLTTIWIQMQICLTL
jgi:hypothetical protein